MPDTRFDEIDAAFRVATRLEGRSRTDYLEHLRDSDPVICREVEALLRYYVKEEQPLDGTVEGLTSSSRDTIGEVAETFPNVPGYHVKGVVGRGGMGVVFEAEKLQPRRRIALKVLRPFLVATKALKRFELESEVLARLDHPGIAQVVDAGSFREGDSWRPFFAMEFVDGTELLEYSKRRGVDEKVRLLVQICDAIQHAHQRGVIHRDIKPGNILVDRHGQTKVLDFGIAQTAEEEALSSTVHPIRGRAVFGTLAYMSPEQAREGSARVDARADIFSLGATGFELLSGHLPLSGEEELEATSEQGRLKSLSDHDPRLRGDLEFVIGKALAEDPEARYPSVTGLMRDLQRFLAKRPIDARPHSAFYALSLFYRRNRLAVAAIALILMAIAAGWTSTWTQMRRAQTAEALARRETRVARQHAARRKEVTDFVRELLTFSRPDRGGSDTRLEEVLLNAEECLAREPIDDLLVDSEVRHLLGSTYLSIGMHKKGLPFLEQAFERRSALLGRGAPETLKTTNALAEVYHQVGQFEKAVPLVEEDLRILMRDRGMDDPDTLRALNDQSVMFFEAGKVEEGVQQLREVVARRKEVLGLAHEKTLVSMTTLSSMLHNRGHLKEALETAEASYEVCFTHDVPLHVLLRTATNVAFLKRVLKRHREALEILERTGERIGSAFDDHSVDVVYFRQELANAYWVTEQRDKAIALMRSVVESNNILYGPDHHASVTGVIDLAMFLGKDPATEKEAEELLLNSIARARILNPKAVPTGLLYSELGRQLIDRGRFAHAQESLVEALAVFKAVYPVDQYPEGHFNMTTVNSSLSRVYLQTEQWDEAEPLIRDVLELDEKQLGSDHIYIAHGQSDLALCLLERGAYAEAVELLQSAVEAGLRKPSTSPHHLEYWEGLLGAVQALQGDEAAGGEALRSAYEQLVKRARRDTWNCRTLHRLLVAQAKRVGNDALLQQLVEGPGRASESGESADSDR